MSTPNITAGVASAADQIARLRHALEAARLCLEDSIEHATNADVRDNCCDALVLANSALAYGTAHPESEGGEA